jgi:hypothetical protein
MLPRNSSRLLISRILLFAGLALCGSGLKADVIYTNFGPLFDYTDGNGVIVSNSLLEKSVAEELPVLTASYDLSTIEFVAATETPSASNTVTVGIYADNGGVPAATALETITLTGQLALFDGSLSPVLTATSVTHPLLSAGSQYWLVMDGPQSEYLVWDLNSTLTEGYLETNGTPGNWQNSPNPFTGETNGVFEVDGTLVSSPTPEPGTWMLLAGGLALIAVFHRPMATSSFRLR